MDEGVEERPRRPSASKGQIKDASYCRKLIRYFVADATLPQWTKWNEAKRLSTGFWVWKRQFRLGYRYCCYWLWMKISQVWPSMTARFLLIPARKTGRPCPESRGNIRSRRNGHAIYILDNAAQKYRDRSFYNDSGTLYSIEEIIFSFINYYCIDSTWF